jgi:20S proteasome alpha/beta subunit
VPVAPVHVRETRLRPAPCVPSYVPPLPSPGRYDEPLRVESLTQALCDLALSFGEGSEGSSGSKSSKMSRPFGVALLLAGVDARGCQLYHMDPSGTYTQYDAQAIGNGSEAARTILLERFNKSLSLADAAALVVRVLSETMEEKVRGSAASTTCSCRCDGHLPASLRRSLPLRVGEHKQR